MNLEFCRYIWIFVVTLEFRPYANKLKLIIVPTKYLWFTNRIWRRIACFRPKTTKLSARLAQTHSSFFRVSGSSVSSLRNKSTKNTDILYRQNMLFYQQDIIDWLRRIMFSTQEYQNFGSLARNHLWVFSSFWFLVGINSHEREHITSVTNTRTFTNKIINRIVCFRRN